MFKVFAFGLRPRYQWLNRINMYVLTCAKMHWKLRDANLMCLTTHNTYTVSQKNKK